MGIRKSSQVLQAAVACSCWPLPMEPRRSARIAVSKNKELQLSQVAATLLVDGENDGMGRRDGRGRPRKTAEEKRIDAEEGKHSRDVHWFSFMRMSDVASMHFGVGCVDDLSDAQYDVCLQRVHDYYKKNPERRREHRVEWDCGPASSAERYSTVALYDPANPFARSEATQPSKRQKIRMCHWYTRSQMWYTAVRLYGAKYTTDIGKVFLDSPWKFRNYWKGNLIALDQSRVFRSSEDLEAWGDSSKNIGEHYFRGVEQLSDEEYNMCLASMNSHFQKHGDLRTRDGRVLIETDKGPGACEQRACDSRADYNGVDGGRVFKWYAPQIFHLVLIQRYRFLDWQLFRGFDEHMCMEALQLTHRKLAAERWTHSHLEAFAGPQCFPQLLKDRARLLANGFSLVTPGAAIGRCGYPYLLRFEMQMVQVQGSLNNPGRFKYVSRLTSMLKVKCNAFVVESHEGIEHMPQYQRFLGRDLPDNRHSGDRWTQICTQLLREGECVNVDGDARRHGYWIWKFPAEKKVEWSEAETLGGWKGNSDCYFCRRSTFGDCRCQSLGNAPTYDYFGWCSIRYCPKCWERCSWPEPWTHCVREAVERPCSVGASISSGRSAASAEPRVRGHRTDVIRPFGSK